MDGGTIGYMCKQILKRIKQIPSYFKLLQTRVMEHGIKGNKKLPFSLKGLKVDALKKMVPHFSWSSLVTQGTILIIMTCVIPLSIIGWYFTTQTMASLTEAAIEKNNKVADRIASDIGANILSKKNFLMVASADNGIREMEKDTVGKYLALIKPYNIGNEALFVALADGGQIFRTDNGALVTIADRDYKV